MAKSKKLDAQLGGAVKWEAFLMIFIASFSIGFIVCLITWLFTVDYIFVVLK
jgi:hypothetical protein